MEGDTTMEKSESERIKFKPNVENLTIPKNLQTEEQLNEPTIEVIIIPE